VSYEIKILGTEASNHTCGILKRKHGKNRTTKINDSTKKLTLGCKPGYFGKNCEIGCRNVLGDKYEYCEAHRLCQNENCTCAWGYAGPLCNCKYTNLK
jgi:hypothetical protein